MAGMRPAHRSETGGMAEEARWDPSTNDTKYGHNPVLAARYSACGCQRQTEHRGSHVPAVGSTMLRKWDEFTRSDLPIETQEYFEQAAQLALNHGQNQLYPEHLLAALVSGRSQKTRHIISSGGANLAEVQSQLKQRIESLGQTRTKDDTVRLSRSMRQFVCDGSRIAQLLAEPRLSTDILLLAFVNAMGNGTKIQVHRMQSILEERNLSLRVQDRIKSYGAHYQDDKHAHPCAIRRLIPKSVRDNIVSDILANLIKDGDTIVIDAGADSMILTAVAKH